MYMQCLTRWIKNLNGIMQLLLITKIVLGSVRQKQIFVMKRFLIIVFDFAQDTSESSKAKCNELVGAVEELQELLKEEKNGKI